MSPLSTSTNPLTKPKRQWSLEDRKLANQDKRLKGIIISFLPNDVIKSVIKCAIAKAMWNDLILAHKGPSDTRDTKIAALRLKFNALKALEGEKLARKWLSINQTSRANISIKTDNVAALFGKYNYKVDSDSDVKEDTRSSSKFLADLNAKFHYKALLANQKRFYKRFGRVGSAKKPMDKSKETCFAYGKLVSSEDEGVTKVKAFMAIAEDEPYVRKNDARSVPDNIVHALGGRGKRKETISSKEVVFTKADISPSKTVPEITYDSESECDDQKPLPPLPILLGDESNSTLNDVISLSDLTLTLTASVEIKKVPDKKSMFKAPKKKAQTTLPYVPDPIPVKKVDSSIEQILLTLMEEAKRLKEHIKAPSDNSASVSQTWSSKSTTGKKYMA
ncbi:hypothetical protein Tco_1466837 [Tanacetum coccineum]